MPCMCWYEPSEEAKIKLKFHCQEIVNIIKEAEKEGDPLGISVKHAQELIRHLYNPSMCEEKNKGEQSNE